MGIVPGVCPAHIQNIGCGVFTHSKAPQALPTQPIPENGRMSTLHPDSELMDLLDRIAAQDDAALKRLYERTSSQLFGLALRIVRNRDACGDERSQAWAEAVLVDTEDTHAAADSSALPRSQRFPCVDVGQCAPSHQVARCAQFVRLTCACHTSRWPNER